MGLSKEKAEELEVFSRINENSFTNTFNRTFIINIKQTEQLIKMLVLLLLHLIDATANYLVAKMSLTLL